jgi:hypothetical protein
MQLLFPPMTDAMLAGAEAEGARLVLADDTWMYGAVDRPMTEDLPSRPVSDRGVLRAWLAEKQLRAHDSPLTWSGRSRGRRGCDKAAPAASVTGW